MCYTNLLCRFCWNFFEHPKLYANGINMHDFAHTFLAVVSTKISGGSSVGIIIVVGAEECEFEYNEMYLSSYLKFKIDYE